MPKDRREPLEVPEGMVPCHCRRRGGEWECGGSAVSVIQVSPEGRGWRSGQKWTLVAANPQRTECDNCRTCPGWAPPVRRREEVA